MEYSPKLEGRFWRRCRRSVVGLAGVTLVGIVYVTGSAYAGDSPLTASGPGLRTPASAAASESARLKTSGPKLTLTGTIVGTPRRALISVEGRQDELFSVGQAVTGGVFLTDVSRRGAVIRRNGVLEKLELRRVARVESDPPVFSPPPPDVEVVRDQESDSLSLRRDFSNKLFESADFSTHARIVPEPNGGFQISDIVPGSLFERLGLSDGDAIRTINGVPVKTIHDLANLSQQRNSTDKLLVGLARGGNLYNMQFDPETGIEIEAVRAPVE